MKPYFNVFGGLLLVTLVFASSNPRPTVASLIAADETRCGWFSNPTPANAWLIDRDGEWTIGVQGGHQAEGDWPDFKPSQWVETNVHYGYGCACLRVNVNKQTHEVMEIKSARARPLSQCRRDPALKKLERKMK
jgi:hypothetical protein